MNQTNEHRWSLLLVATILIVSCIVPSSVPFSVPTLGAEALNTIIAQTVAAAATQTAMAMLPDTETPTVTLTASNIPTLTPSLTSSFFTPLPTLGLLTPTPALLFPTKTPFAERTRAAPTQVPSATLPAPVPTDTPITDFPTATSTPCPSMFSCARADLPSFPLPAGGPNSGFEHCVRTTGETSAWIHEEITALGFHLEHGQTAYFFACEFPELTLDTLIAQMSGPNYDKELEVLSAIPNSDVEIKKEERVVAWNATCDLEPGKYSLTIQDASGIKADPLFFTLDSTDDQWILPVRRTASAGTTFEIYYCGYGAQAGKNVLIDFYFGIKRTGPEDEYDFYHLTEWNVPINGSGWFRQSLPSSAGDPEGLYLLIDREQGLKGEGFIWLTP